VAADQVRPRRRPRAVALGDHRAGHQLDLVEQHQRQDQDPAVAPGNRMPAIGTPVARLFLEPQNTMATLVGLGEAQGARAEHGGGQHDRQQRAADHQQEPSSGIEILCQMPPITAALKAE
jgi:hypothetical protein